MKKRLKFALFATLQILLVVAHIHKRSLFVRELYQEQRTTALKRDLEHKKQELIAQLYIYKNPISIKEFATQKLSMRPIDLTQIKKITPV